MQHCIVWATFINPSYFLPAHMAEFKLVISDPKTGRSIQKEIKEDAALPFLQKKLGDKFEGDAVALPGYTFEITGGSDYCGFPLRKGIPGIRRKAILAGKGVGFRLMEKALKVRKSVCPDVINETIKQINAKVITFGSEPLFPQTEAKEAEKTG